MTGVSATSGQIQLEKLQKLGTADACELTAAGQGEVRQLRHNVPDLQGNQVWGLTAAQLHRHVHHEHSLDLCLRPKDISSAW